jgi:ElaB/YqjD/DUF883 family membrane-anchored ribosome-binding protein
MSNFEQGDARRSGSTTAGETRDRMQGTADEVRDRAGDVAGQVKHQAQETASQAKEQLERGREHAGEYAENAAEMVREKAHERGGVQEKVGVKAADAMERTAGYLRENRTDEIWDDIERLAREHPIQALGGAVLAGFLIGRILR